jgi:hypothetical protein
MSHYLGNIRLTGFLESRIIEDETNDGRRQKGVFIPLEINGLKLYHDMSVYAPVYIMQRRIPHKGTTHYIRQKVSKDHLRQLEELGIELSYLGDMRPYYKFKTDDKRDGSVNRVNNFNDNDYE